MKTLKNAFRTILVFFMISWIALLPSCLVPGPGYGRHDGNVRYENNGRHEGRQRHEDNGRHKGNDRHEGNKEGKDHK